MPKKRQKRRGKRQLKKTRPRWLRALPFVVIIGGIAAVVYLLMSSGEGEVKKYEFKKEGTLSFHKQSDESYKTIDIEIADNEYERQLGLMHRTEMQENQGMLFIFPGEGFLSFWMKNTNLSLDIMFINSQQKIVTIHTNTTPQSEKSYRATELARYVLEVKAGFVKKFGVTAGDSLTWNRE